MSESTPKTENLDSFGGAVCTVSGLTLISRVLGLARDLLLVRVFGNTALGSAFAAAFAIPNLFRRLFGEGALSAAFLPRYAQARKDDPVVADRFATAIVLLTALITGSLLLVMELALTGVLAALPRDPERDRSLGLVMLMLPFMPLVCVSAALGGVLHVHRVFAPTAAAPVLLNVFMIAGGAWHFLTSADPARSAQVIGVLAVAAAGAQIVWALLALHGRVRWSKTLEGAGPMLRSTLRAFVPVALGLGVIQINAFLDTLIAMYPNWVGPEIMGRPYPLEPDANAVLFFTQRLYQFPLGVFGIAVATAIFPVLADNAKDAGRFARTLARGVRLSLFISVPATLGLIVVRHDAVATLFSGGESGFNAAGVDRSAAVLMGYSAAIWAYSLNHVMARSFYARGDTRTPVLVACGAVLLNLVLNIVLIWPLAEAGLAWATAISGCAHCVLLAHLARRKAKIFAPGDGKAVLVTLVVSVVMAGCVWLTLSLWPEPASWIARAVRLLGCGVVGIGVYTGAALLLRRDEARWLLERSAR